MLSELHRSSIYKCQSDYPSLTKLGKLTTYESPSELNLSTRNSTGEEYLIAVEQRGRFVERSFASCLQLDIERINKFVESFFRLLKRNVPFISACEILKLYFLCV